MKHLLIIISILLLSSPVIGNNHKGETLYRWKNPTGDGYVWKGFGDKETHPKYKGDVKNGKPDGLGYLISPDGWKYVGSWKDGKKNGQGTYTWSSGSKYVGEFKNGKKNGQGTYTYKGWEKKHLNGSKYVGEWKDGWEWNGTYYDKDGKIEYKYVNGKNQ